MNTIYRRIISNPEIVHKYVIEWAVLLGEEWTIQDFQRWVRRIYSYTIVTKLQSFQYHILCHGIITNVHLFHYKIRENNLCSFCNREIESILHLFCECEIVTHLWNYVKKIIKQTNITKTQILLNTVTDNPKMGANCIVLFTKFYIYRTRCLQESLTVNGLQKFIQDQINIEFCIAKNKVKVSQHQRKWEDYQLFGN